MKRIFLNIKNFIRYDSLLFCLFSVCIVASTIAILFMFGFVQNTKQEMLEGQYGISEIQLYVEDKDRDYVLLEDIKTCLSSLDENILNKCYFLLAVQFSEDRSEYWEIDDMYSWMWTGFCIQDGKFTSSQKFDEWCVVNGAYVKGDGFTPEQVENGELVCIAKEEIPNYIIVGEYSNASVENFTHKYDLDDEGKVVIDGKTYSVIGRWRDFYPWQSEIPSVPVTTLNGDCSIQLLFIRFDNYVSKEEYMNIKQTMRQFFGNHVKIAETNFTEMDVSKNYLVTILQCVFMMALAGIVVSVLFEYIILKRKKQLSVYRICGLSLEKVYCSLILECLLYVTVFGTLGGLLFHFGLLPYFKTVYKYMATYYMLQNYLILGGAYLVVITIVIYLMMKKTIRPQIVGMMKEVS